MTLCWPLYLSLQLPVYMLLSIWPHYAIIVPCLGVRVGNVQGCCFRYKDLAAMNGEVGEVALALYCATVRATLFVCKGYECQEKEGVFMTAFPGPIKALEWAVTLQMALLRSA